MQQRYYDPIAGRFLSVDPITTDATTGAHFSRYDYVSNNPFKYTDPDGRAKSSGGGFGFGWEEVSNFADTTITGGYGLQFKQAANAGNYGEAGLKLTAGVVYGVLNVATLGEGAAIVAAASKGLNFAAKGIGGEALQAILGAKSMRGNFNIGSMARSEMDAAGTSWVGPNARAMMKGETQIGWTSADGLKTYRFPQLKENGVAAGRTQGNLTEFLRLDNGQTQILRNAHIDLLP